MGCDSSQEKETKSKIHIGSRQNFKVITAGETGIGKSTIINCYKNGPSKSRINQTVIIDLNLIDINSDFGTANVQIFDTSGQECVRNLVQIYFRNTNAALLVYDITNRETFNRLSDWLERIRNQESNAIIILIENKTDLESERVIPYDEATNFYEENKLDLFVEVSALSGEGINYLFLSLAELLLKNKNIKSNFFT
jgi:small GTP-binding protein